MKEKVISLISGGIDSPVATITAAREFEVIPLHFCLYPMSSEENFYKTIEALKNVQKKINFEKAILFPWGGVLTQILNEIQENYTCLACRKSMLITASKLCESEDAGGIVTGESLGQKASQTIENIRATSSKINLPILRPALGMNKEEIVNLSKEWGIWRADHAGCCLATPNNPRTKADPQKVDKELEKIELQNIIEKHKDLILRVKNLDREFDDYLLELASKFG